MEGCPVTMCRISKSLLLVFMLCGHLHHVTWGYTSTDEENLRTSIFTGYNSDVRPQTPVQVNLTMTLMSLNYLDIGAQEMCVNIVLISEWNDNRLSWTPASHNGIDAIVVKYGTVWLPSIVIENTIDDAGLFGDDEAAPSRVNSDGGVQWISPGYVRVSCTMAVTYFPFDEQNCFISVYGWAQDVSEMAFEPSIVGWYLNIFSKNGEWDLEDTSIQDYLANDGALTFKSLYFRVTFKRKWLFPFLTLLVPGVLNSILMCAVFYVPFEGVDKLGYSLTVLLSYYVLLTYVSDTLPATSTNISILQAYLTFVMIAGTLSTLLSVWVVVIFYLEDDVAIPDWVVYLYDMSSIVLCHKGSCERISNICRACKCCGKNRTEQVHHSDVMTIGSDEKKNHHPLSSVATSLSSLSSTSQQPKNDQRDITADKTKSMLSPNGLSAVNNASTDLAAVKNIDSSRTHNNGITNDSVIWRKKFSCVCSKSNNAFVKSGQNLRCDACNGFVSSKQANLDIEQYNGDKGEEETKVILTWKMVAKRMDAVFFRIVGGSISLFTVILVIILLAHY